MQARHLILIAACLLCSTTDAQTYSTQGGTTEFTSRVPLHTFTGSSSYLTGEINFATNGVDFFLDLETLRTGNGRRDRDMRETLETNEHPFAEFTGSLTSAFDMDSNAPQSARVQGSFTIHGVSRSVTITGTLQKTSSGIRLVASWDLRLEHYNIEPPRLLVVRVNQVQSIVINALLTQ